MTRRARPTPAISETDPVECRVFSVPAGLLGAFDSAVAQLCVEEFWTHLDPAAATVADTVAAYAAIIEAAYNRGCMVVGEVLELAVSTIPPWALLCDGATYADADWPELGAAINPALRVDATHFRVPDRNQRIGLYGPPVGFQGGENDHTLTTVEIPSHGHVDTGHSHLYNAPTGEFLALGPGEEPVVLAQTPSLTGDAAANITNTGGGGAHNNMQQYEGVYMVIIARSTP